MKVRGRLAARWMISGITSVILTWAVTLHPAIAQQVSLSGRLQVAWGDPSPDSRSEPVQAFAIIDDQDEWTPIVLNETLTRSFGGLQALQGKRVKVIGEMVHATYEGSHARPFADIQARSVEFEIPEGAGAATAEMPSSAVTGSQPWATILCRFSDSIGVTPHDVGFFNTLMGSSYLGHYWRELSYEQFNLTGSAVFGWYNLPHPRSYYVNDTGANLSRLKDDCTAVADTDVFFPNFAGINLVFNDTLDCCSWGAWGLRLDRDGESKSYGMTWIASWGHTQSLLAHEMGHGFGLPHSSGPYSVSHDSSWDVMSRRIGTCASSDAVYGCVAPHTIAYHKNMLGWIPFSRTYVHTVGSSHTITLERIAQPVSDDYLMAQIPIGGSRARFYTVEARYFAGHDENVPGEAVVIHDVDITRSRSAQVVDPDDNGDPNDSAAMWTPGETFTDSANQISVTVDAATATGFQVTITSFTSAPYVLTVTTAGTGSGIVTGDGIACPGDCAEVYNGGAVVTLNATANPGSLFVGWSGDPDCADGRLTIDTDKNCTATFASATGPDLIGTWSSVSQSCHRDRCTLRGDVQVVNQGDATAHASRLRIFLSDDAVLDPNDDTVLEGLRIRKLRLGRATMHKVKVRLRRRITASGKYLFAVVDALDRIAELDETNNLSMTGPIP
ncbi:MAG: hypothetical protein F9K13_12260 [Candidatus Methylomirabilis oxygeniifera]|nr:MAG: hypothetical protein F9K13_12260 [Candidatus Methylomirabilis oxyfera]